MYIRTQCALAVGVSAISKPKILEIINRYKRKVLGIFPQCKPLEKGALFM